MNRSPQCSCVLGISIFFALIVVGFLLKPSAQAAKNELANASTISKQHFAEAYGKLPLSFEANTGQTSREVKFLSRGSGHTLFLTRHGEAVLQLDAAKTQQSQEPKANATVAASEQSETTIASAFRMKLVNANVNPSVEGLEQLPGKANYFIGNDPKKWRANVPTFAKVNFHGVYPGVDLAYYGNQQRLEYDFIVAPGADPRSITLSFTGAEKLSVDSQGNLVLAAKEGELRFEKPRIYQQVDGERQEISGGYVLKHAHEVGFQIAAYDTTKSLIIDPVLSYSTFFPGGTTGIAMDADGNAYLTGSAGSSGFPTTPGAFQTTANGSPYRSSVFVTKLNPAGSALVYSTYIGGATCNDYANGIAIDEVGNAYVTGYTCSQDFPTTPGAFQVANKSAIFYNAYVTQLNPTGSALVYSTYLGGSQSDTAQDIAVDMAGNAYVTGSTTSTDFPTTPGAVQATNHSSTVGIGDAFVTKLNASGTGLIYSTYLGGSGSLGCLQEPGCQRGDMGVGIATDAAGNAFITGSTNSSDFPTTVGAFQPVALDQGNAFVTKLNPSGSLIYSTYLGGASGSDQGNAIAVDNAGNAYVAGYTASLDFPTTVGAFQPVARDQGNAFVSILDSAGAGLVYSTFLGGTGSDYGFAIALDAAGNVYVTGSTGSTDFPTTPDALQKFKNGDLGSSDAFVTVLNPARLASQALVYSTYLGGSPGPEIGVEYNSSGRRIVVGMAGDAYVAGWTVSPNFPTTPGAFQTKGPGAFVAKFSGF